MSKSNAEYHVSVNRSRWQFWLVKAFLLLSLASIGLWPQMVSWQWMVQLLVALPVVWLIGSGAFVLQTERQFVLNDIGDVQLPVNGELMPFKLVSSSVTCDWFCYLVLLPAGLGGYSKQRFFVFRDGVDERSYRRLCRVILRLRR